MHLALFAAFSDRLTLLVPLLILGLLIGEPLANLLGFPTLRKRIAQRIAALNTKLNRRSTATRVYRGIAVLLMLELPAILLGLILARDHTATHAIAALLFILLIGAGTEPYRLLRQWRAAKRGTLTLQLDSPAYVFADTFSLVRYEILRSAERFSVIIIGGSLYALAFGITGLLAYLALAAAANFYTPTQADNRAFGWAAHALFYLADAPPRFLARILLWLAALFTPQTQPFTALKRCPRAFHGWLAAILNLSLGGPMPHPSGELILPWAGTGTPKLTAREFSRSLQLLITALLLWILLLGSTIVILDTVL